MGASCQRHWLKDLLRQVSLYLGSSWSGDLLGPSIGSVAGASRSAQRESPFLPRAPDPRVPLS
ncbi:hypothetical protein DFAR_2870004 [Desulfarculales bacterium]